MPFERVRELFDLSGQVAVVTGGSGFLGTQHAEIIAAAGGTPVLLDLPETCPQQRAAALAGSHGVQALGICTDIADSLSVERACDCVLNRFGQVDILINNAANNPKIEGGSRKAFARLEDFPLDMWDSDLRVGLLGSFLCSRVFGAEMVKRKRGVVVNIASDLALIGPDQRLYREDGLPNEDQPVKPVTYSVINSGLLGLTRYLATYWNEYGIRVNAISPGGVSNGQSPEFVARISRLIPLGRMARINEYQGAILFLCSDASSYMTGANLVIDGGRSCW